MKSGIFHVPYMRPERTARETFEWSIRCAVEADNAGFSDFMVGEHATQAWESIPNPEIVIGAAAHQTQNIRFAPMAHLLPLHLPGSLAIQVGWLSQVLEGRYFLGVAAGAFGRDAIIRGQPADLSEAHPREIEALEIMERVWKREPFHYEGKYYTGGFPEESEPQEGDVEEHVLPDFSPWGGRENLEIAVAGLSFNSPSMKFAGERDYSPISFFGGSQQMKSHWDTYEAAALENGHSPDRSRFRVCRDVFVADTDEEAKRRAINGGIGETWRRYLVPIYKRFGILQGYIDDSGSEIDMSEVDMDFLAEHVWLCGSPETVIGKLEWTAEQGGSWGTVCMNSHDSIDDPEPWIESMHRIAKEVVPKVQIPVSASTA